MSMDTAELVSEWDSVPFDGGYEGLRTLRDQEFSGAVVSGSARLFMLNGTVVGILDGELDTFEEANGTARQAPHEALPLLVVMQARADEPRAQYYTQDTPISDVDRTLSDGKFTGYVELSENVLSGDYYIVYHQGRQMSVAWVGSSQKLVTDDEAFEQADGEVGIYNVMPAEIEPVELPEPETEVGTETPTEDVDESGASETVTTTSEPDTPSDNGGGTAPTTSGATGAEDRTDTEQSGGTQTQSSADSPAQRDERTRGTTSGPPGSKAAGASQGTAVDNAVSTERSQPSEAAADIADDRQSTPEPGEADRESATESVGADAPGTTQSEPTQPEETDHTAGGTSTPDQPEATQADPEEYPTAAANSTESPETGYTEPETGANQSGSGSQSKSQSGTPASDSATAASLETKSIPSLDPAHSASDDTAQSGEPATPTDGAATSESVQQQSVSPEPEPEPEPSTERQPSQPSQPDSGRVADLEAEVEARDEQIADLEAELRELSAQNEELAAERDRLQANLEDAQAEIRRLEERLEAADTGATGGVQLSAAEAIDGTNLFVRYHSKSEATLAKAQDGSVDKDAVEENLRLESHTQFDSDEAVVDGDAFETFLQESIQYRFVNWLVRELLYEIRETGHENKMSVLYDALPEIDRAELNGQVSVVYTEDGKEHREQTTFDVVVRDRMGNPLVVANINDSREAATDAQMTDIVQTAERVGNSSKSLAGAFLVTSSFFEPEALETAEEATSSGLFSRDKRKSFVNLSRKDGYHLCLLEARNQEFHLAVPEL